MIWRVGISKVGGYSSRKVPVAFLPRFAIRVLDPCLNVEIVSISNNDCRPKQRAALNLEAGLALKEPAAAVQWQWATIPSNQAD